MRWNVAMPLNPRRTVFLLGAAGAATLGYRAYQQRRELSRSSQMLQLSMRRAADLGVYRVKRVLADESQHAALDEQFLIRSASDVAAQLGEMKGAIMKAGQMLSFVADGLPGPAQEALASLQADVPPMAPELARQVIERSLGARPEEIFAEWGEMPIAAASIGQVHRARLEDGRFVAVKVQYPGVGEAISTDLNNAERMYAMFSAFALPGMDVKGIVDELRARMGEELDYRIEAREQQFFADSYLGHPTIRIPEVIPEFSTEQVLTSAWVEGLSWSRFLDTATDEAKQLAGETIFRFSQRSINKLRRFNGDPHPGNYKFHEDGSVTFLDFGLTKVWEDGEMELMDPVLDGLLERDHEATVAAMQDAHFIVDDHGLDPYDVWRFVGSPYIPYLDERFVFTSEFVGRTLGKILNLNGPYAEVIKALNMPKSFVLLDRVVWGVSAILGKLEADNRWRGILAEYRQAALPATPLGELEADWLTTRLA